MNLTRPARGTCQSCQAAILWVASGKQRADGTRATLIVDAVPAKRLVVGSLITTLDQDDGIVVGAQHPDAPIVGRMVDTYVDHHSTCPKAQEWKGRRRGAA